MSGRWTSARRSVAAGLVVFFAAAILAVSVGPAHSSAMSQIQVTLDQETGDQPIRYSFEAITDSSATSVFFVLALIVALLHCGYIRQDRIAPGSSCNVCLTCS